MTASFWQSRHKIGKVEKLRFKKVTPEPEELRLPVRNSDDYIKNASQIIVDCGVLNAIFASDALSGLQTVLLHWTNIMSSHFGEASGRFLQADNFVINQNQSVPEPGSLALIGLGLLCSGLACRQRA